MDPEQTFIRVQERFSHVLTPRVRAVLEYAYLLFAIVLFCILVVLHANYVQQPGCSNEFPTDAMAEAQIIQIKIIEGLMSVNDSEMTINKGIESLEQSVVIDDKELDTKSSAVLEENIFHNLKVRMDKFSFKIWKNDKEHPEKFQRISSVVEGAGQMPNGLASLNDQSAMLKINPSLAKETGKAAVAIVRKKWVTCLALVWNLSLRWNGVIQKLWNITGIRLDLDAPKWLKFSCLDKINTYAVNWLEKRTKSFETTYFYAAEKGYFLLPEEAKARHNIRTANVSISAWHSCFGNRWQQLLINRMVGYDTILMNSLLTSPGKGGYLFNFNTKEFFNLSYGSEPYDLNAKFGDYLAKKCGVLMMSLFVFFTTTLSVSFTLRETQTRMLKFTVQLQHHARHRLPTFQLIFVHVVESLVFVPIMVGILFFLFEFYDDQLLAFMVLILVWLCELFTLISVRTPISMKFFPRFFLLYFLVFHIYFFSYAYGFSYLALSTTAAFMQHLILYFWNRFEVPALQMTWRSNVQQQPGFQITSSTILASTFHITRLNGGLQGSSPRNPQNNQSSDDADSGTMNSFSNLLLWILGGAYSESFSSFLSIFRDQLPSNDSRNPPNDASN